MRIHPAMLIALILVGVMAGITVAPKILRPMPPQECAEAFSAADARYALSESTTALVYDQWRADNLGDAHGVEYAAAGIEQNTKEIDTLTTDYLEAKEQCQ